jgi:aspartate/methionine/tyrosine aminotransferase
MPRPPDLSRAAGRMPASIFARLVEKLASFSGEVIPFHLGDTHVLPPQGARLDAIPLAESPPARWYAYGQPAGDPALIEAIRRKLAKKNQLEVPASAIQVTAGATHAFFCLAQALLEPGDEVLVLTPAWPLFRGHLAAVGASAVEVPISQRVLDDPELDVAALIDAKVTPKTVAIYMITPGNPDGTVLSRAQLEAIGRVAQRHDLWILADEVYEDYCFDGRAHVSLATLPGLFDRTLSVFSFSKSYAQAGLRVGYVVGPEKVMVALRKFANHSVYNVPRALQRLAQTALEDGDAFLAATHQAYRAARDRALALCPVPARKPHGGSYLFLDLRPYLRPGDACALDLLERVAAAGVLLAPGVAFGSDYSGWARLCYTAVPAERLEEGMKRLASVLG